MSSENKYKYIGMTIYTNESKKKVEFNDFSFINKEVGGHFECITIPDMTIWINEEGKIDETKGYFHTYVHKESILGVEITNKLDGEDKEEDERVGGIRVNEGVGYEDMVRQKQGLNKDSF